MSFSALETPLRYGLQDLQKRTTALCMDFLLRLLPLSAITASPRIHTLGCWLVSAPVMKSDLLLCKTLESSYAMTLYRIQEAELEIPENWQDQSINIFKLPATEVAKEATFIISRDFSQGEESFPDYVGSQLKNAERQLPGFKLMQTWDFTSAGHAATLLDYSWKREERELMLRQVFLQHKPAVLIITLTTTPEDLIHHEPAWKYALSTLVPRRIGS